MAKGVVLGLLLESNSFSLVLHAASSCRLADSKRWLPFLSCTGMNVALSYAFAGVITLGLL